jgi:predicted DNA-binding transcriptional regulator YafY
MVFNAREAIIQLGLMFQEGHRLSRKMIEKQFNISSRTVYRYIATLRREYNAPIVYDDIDEKYSCSTSWNIMEQLKK